MLHLRHREAEAGQQLLTARAYRVGVGIGQCAIQLADQRAVGGALGFALQKCELVFQTAQGDVAVDGVFQCRAVERRRFLRDVSHAPLARKIDLALIGVQFTAQQAKQA